MKEESSGGHEAAGMRDQRATFRIDHTKLGYWKVFTVDDDLSLDLNGLARQRHDGLDERAQPARTETAAQIPPITRHEEFGYRRRANKDEIADDWLPVERCDPPQTIRIARGQTRRPIARPTVNKRPRPIAPVPMIVNVRRR